MTSVSPWRSDSLIERIWATWPILWAVDVKEATMESGSREGQKTLSLEILRAGA